MSTIGVIGRFPVERAVALGVDHRWREAYIKWWLDTQPLLTGADREYAAGFIEPFLADDRHFAFTPVLLHHDLSEDHLLVDGAGRLTGVIDFEDAIIGDPAFDFIGVAHLGPDVLDHYGGPIDAGWAERMHFYRRLWPLHELRYGFGSGNQQHIRRGLERLRAGM